MGRFSLVAVGEFNAGNILFGYPKVLTRIQFNDEVILSNSSGPTIELDVWNLFDQRHRFRGPGSYGAGSAAEYQIEPDWHAEKDD